MRTILQGAYSKEKSTAWRLLDFQLFAKNQNRIEKLAKSFWPSWYPKEALLKDRPKTEAGHGMHFTSSAPPQTRAAS
jgi:hypothetical protein